MKHIQTFESFVNEGTKFNPKPFNQVKPGNTAHVIGDDNAWEVVATGYGKDFEKKLKQYDESGAVTDMQMSPGNYGMEPADFDELELIAVEHGIETAVYTYGDDGAWVNK